MKYERRTIKIYENVLKDLREVPGDTDNERIAILIARNKQGKPVNVPTVIPIIDEEAGRIARKLIDDEKIKRGIE